MLKLICASTFVLIFSSPTLANPWTVREGSTLLDGTVTATRVSGYMFSGKEYESTSSQVHLECEDSKLLMHIIGDSDFLREKKAQESPTIEFIFKAGSKLATFKATITNAYSRDWARVHNGTDLLDFLRFYDGGSAKVQLPVARTGIPEVRRLSLKNFVKTTDLILATCGPLDAWEPVSAITKK
jgi:hypothetical protein